MSSTLSGPLTARLRADTAAAAEMTAIVVSYECRELLRSCLASLARQTIGARLRVVVVDNASADGTGEMVRSEFPWVQLIENERNEGFGRASNAGLRLVESGHVLMLNPDTVLPEDGLERALAAMLERPTVGVLGCRLLQPDGAVDHAARRQIPTPATSLAYFLKVRRRGGGGAYTDLAAFDREGVVGAVNGAFMLLRYEVVQQVGGFDEAFWMYGEDLDLCLRVTQAGWDVYYWPGVDVMHVKGGSSGRARSLRVNWAFHHAMWIFFHKHHRRSYGAWVSALVLTGIAARFVLSTAWSALARTSGAARRRLHREGS